MASNDLWESDRAYRRQLTPSPEDVELTFLEVVAEVEGCEISDLPRLWPAIDSLLQHGFTSPPDESAEVAIEFTYAGYRARIDQTGAATLVKLSAAGDA